MTIFITYLIITIVIGFALMFAMVGGDSEIGSFGNFFNPRILRQELSFSVKATVIIMLLSYLTMPLFGVAYWFVKFIQYVKKIIKNK